MPFLATDWSCARQHAIALAAKWGAAVSAAAHAAGQLPQRVQRAMLSVFARESFFC